MVKLIATRDILVNYHVGNRYGSHQYEAGDELPADHPDAGTWLECGSAKLVEDEWEPPAHPKAKLVTAEPGQSGLAVGSDAGADNLVGKVPATYQRQRRKQPCGPRPSRI